MIRSIVFDFGNVLGYFDYQVTLRQLCDHTELSAAQMLAAVSAPGLADAYEAGRLSTAEFLCRARQACRLRCDDAFLAAAWCDIFRPNDEVCALVPRLAGRYRLLLGSNTNELHATQFRRQFAQTLRHFDALVLSHEIGARKPEPAFFRQCLRLAGGEAQQCVFIDDLPENVAGARACGWHGIVYRNAQQLSAELAQLRVEF